MHFSMLASSVGCNLSFEYVNSGSNMIVMITGGALSDTPLVPGDSVGVFSIDFNGDEFCAGSFEWDGNQNTIAVWGDDAQTPHKDGFNVGETIVFKAKTGELIYLVSPDAAYTFTANGFAIINTPLAFDVNCEPQVLGCTDANAVNYNAEATTDDGSCFTTLTCPPFSFATLNTGVNMTIMITGDALEAPLVAGDSIGVFTIDNLGNEFCAGSFGWDGEQHIIAVWGDDAQTEAKDGYSSGETIVFKAKSASTYYDVNPSQTFTFSANGLEIINTPMQFIISCPTDDALAFGCTDAAYLEYDASANTDNGSCAILIVEGCTGAAYTEYNALANIDDGSCTTLIVLGCTDESSFNFNSEANTNDGSCINIIEGCTDAAYLEYDASANTDDGSCATLIVEGCTDAAYTEYNALVSIDNGSCTTLIVLGCTDEAYLEFTASANTDNGSCSVLIVEGCTSDIADNYNATANVDNGSCYFATLLSSIDDLTEENEVLAQALANQTIVLEQEQELTNAFSAQVEDLLGDLSEINAANVELTTLSNSLSQSNNTLLTSNDSLSSLLENSQVDLFIMELANDELVDSLETEIAVQAFAINDLSVDLLQSTIALQTSGLLNVTLQDSLVDINENLIALTANIESLESANANLSVHNDNLYAQLGDMTNSLNELSQSVMSMNTLLSDVMDVNNVLESDLDQSQSDTDSLQLLVNSLSENIEESQALLDVAEEYIAQFCQPIYVDLNVGWNMIGYPLTSPQDVVASVSDFVEKIALIKNNQGNFYWPDFGFNGIEDFTPGQGYQFKMDEDELNFTFTNVDGMRIEVYPTVPQWAIDMSVESHPNDVRHLIRTVNMLGQQVDPDNYQKGEILLYLYSDGTVEKKQNN